MDVYVHYCLNGLEFVYYKVGLNYELFNLVVTNF